MKINLPRPSKLAGASAASLGREVSRFRFLWSSNPGNINVGCSDHVASTAPPLNGEATPMRLAAGTVGLQGRSCRKRFSAAIVLDHSIVKAGLGYRANHMFAIHQPQRYCGISLRLSSSHDAANPRILFFRGPVEPRRRQAKGFCNNPDFHCREFVLDSPSCPMTPA